MTLPSQSSRSSRLSTSPKSKFVSEWGRKQRVRTAQSSSGATVELKNHALQLNGLIVEACFHAKMNHENVVQFKGCIHSQSLPDRITWLIMEYSTPVRTCLEGVVTVCMTSLQTVLQHTLQAMQQVLDTAPAQTTRAQLKGIIRSFPKGSAPGPSE
jgi:hypothetical protein